MLPVSVLSVAQLAARNPEPLQRLGGLAGSREFRYHGHTLQGMELINYMDYRWGICHLVIQLIIYALTGTDCRGV